MTDDSVHIQFDPDPTLEALHAHTRKLVFLDQSYWRNLVSTPGAVWATLRARLEASVTRGDLLVPVTSSNLIELSKLTDPAQLRDIAAIMNDLSRSVVFVDTRVRLAREMAFLIRNHRGPFAFSNRRRKHALSIWPATSGPVSLESHPSELGREVAQDIAPAVFQQMIADGIRLTEPHMGGYPDWLRRIDEDYETGMNDIRSRNAAARNLSFEARVREEAAALLKTEPTSFKALRAELGDEVLARFAAAYPTDERKRALYLSGCPTLYTSAHVHAAYLEHGKNYLRSDAYDMENLITAAPYSDIAAFDGHTRHIGSTRLRLDATFNCKFAANPKEILEGMEAPGA